MDEITLNKIEEGLYTVQVSVETLLKAEVATEKLEEVEEVEEVQGSTEEVEEVKKLEIRKPRFDIETGEQIEDEVEVIYLQDLLNRKEDVELELLALEKQIKLFV